MSTKANGSGAGVCDVCQRSYLWGCGHTGSQEYAARKHYATQKHKNRKCKCYGHNHCAPEKCKLAGIKIAGYLPFYQHTPRPE